MEQTPMTSKYDPLGDYLASRQTVEVPMSFADIEKVIGAPLPPKAVDHPAWWSNNTSNNTMTKVWLDAGFRTEQVNIGARKLVFRRVERARATVGGVTLAQPMAQRPGFGAGGLLARTRAALAGTVHLADGVDLTDPTGEVWDAQTS
jgi:hypothetical protein